MLDHSLLLGESGYKVERSLRFRGSASASIGRSYNTVSAVTADAQKGTIAVWVKRGALGTAQVIYSSGTTDASNRTWIYFNESNQLAIYSILGGVVRVHNVWSPVYRDCGALLHIVVGYDTTNADAALRLTAEVNGVSIPSPSPPTQNQAIPLMVWVGDWPARIGGNATSSGGQHFDGLMAEFHGIFAEKVPASAFGETDPVTGVWMPKRYTGTYGTNGFYLDFKDNSAATATTIGADKSGNGNNWTPVNISVASDSTYDSFIDVPTNYVDGGNGRGNYATLNPLHKTLSPNVVLINGNLQANVSGVNGIVNSTIAVSSGKWYWEFLALSSAGDVAVLGISRADVLADWRTANAYGYENTGQKVTAGAKAAYGASYTNLDVIGVALDMDAGTLTFYKNGVSQGVAFSGLSGSFTPSLQHNGASTGAYDCGVNFGQRPFAYTPPSGFKALNTQNLPDPVIRKPKEYFDVVTWASNGGVQTVTGAELRPDLVWTKSRSSIGNHVLNDAVRGTSNVLQSNTTTAESSNPTYLTSFDAGGFSIGSGNFFGAGMAIVSWLWKESPLAGFDIVSYTGTGVAGLQVPHSLGVAPSMVITKSRTATGNWAVYHKSNGPTGTVWLNVTNAFQTNAAYWNNAAPTSSVFSVGSSQSDTNANGVDFIAYVFAEVPGFSKFGSYIGNGSVDGPFVHLGFRARFIMIKRVDSSSDWVIHDTTRNPGNVATQQLYPNLSAEETAYNFSMDITSSGFKLLANASGYNFSGATYIYAAFAENSFKYARAR